MLSHEALALFRQHIGRHGDMEVDDSNRETYRELARAGLMVVGNSFARGEESVYHVTRTGFERKAELLAATATGPSPEVETRTQLNSKRFASLFPRPGVEMAAPASPERRRARTSGAALRSPTPATRRVAQR
jgi:hypothetical protein